MFVLISERSHKCILIRVCNQSKIFALVCFCKRSNKSSFLGCERWIGFAMSECDVMTR